MNVAVARSARPTRPVGPARPPVRLTRRGRFVLVLTVMLLAVVGGIALGHGSSLAAGPGQRPVQHTVVVRGGETLWSLAARIAPRADPRQIVDEIESLNHLAGAGVEPGQQLIVPPAG